jgi:hypothetical protein
VNPGFATNAVAKRDSAPRGRSRKRRPAPARARTSASAGQQTGAAPPVKQPAAADGRPQAPWHPLPLSELLIFVGAIGTVVGLSRARHGISAGGPTLLAGVAAVMIGTIEVTLREHRSGFRSHALILSVLPVIVFHSAVVLIVAAFTPVPRALSLGLLVPDVLLFAALFKLLRARFADAQLKRTIASER